MSSDPPSSLRPLPDAFGRTRLALHRVAEQIVAPARKPDNEIALRATPGGFGTPEFEWDGVAHQVKVDGTELVHRAGESERRAQLSSLASAAAAVSDLIPDPPEDAASLDLDADSAHILGAWFALGADALEHLSAGARPDDDATPPTLWPEHFDVAIELGSEGNGRRANFGFSPGDDDHPQPYVYVGPWRTELRGEGWNATAFNGAELGYSELLAAADPLEAALEFCQGRRTALEEMPTPDE